MPASGAGTLAGEIDSQIAALEHAGLLVDDFVAKPDVPQIAVDRLVTFLAGEGVPVFFVPLIKTTGNLQGASGCPMTFSGRACYILIDSGTGPGAQLSTLAHEWGHIQQSRVDTAYEAEVWAETVAWLALRDAGYDTTRASMSYLFYVPAEARSKVYLLSEKKIRAVAATLTTVIRGA